MDAFVHPSFLPIYREHPLVLADVGARGGLKKNWRGVRPHLRVIGFEPDAHEYARLSGRSEADAHGDVVLNVALDNRAGTVTLNVARDAGLSSIFEPNTGFLKSFPQADRFDIVDRRTVQTQTLDGALKAHQIRTVDFIKVDTQGSELRVLEGAAGVLGRAVAGVEVEVEFAPIYRDQPLFADVDAYLRPLGFQLFDLRPCYWKRQAGRDAGGPYGQVIWADALYFKSIAGLSASLAGLPGDEQKARVLKAVSVALLYGYADFALEIARELARVFTQKERHTIDAAIGSESAGSRGRRMPGRKHVAAALSRLAARVRESPDGWSVSDRYLGNPRR